MKVIDLIDILKTYPEDLPVLTDGYEDGYELIMPPILMELVHKSERPYYSGEYQEVVNIETDTIKALVLPRNVREK